MPRGQSLSGDDLHILNNFESLSRCGEGRLIVPCSARSLQTSWRWTLVLLSKAVMEMWHFLPNRSAPCLCQSNLVTFVTKVIAYYFSLLFAIRCSCLPLYQTTHIIPSYRFYSIFCIRVRILLAKFLSAIPAQISLKTIGPQGNGWFCSAKPLSLIVMHKKEAAYFLWCSACFPKWWLYLCLRDSW